MHNLKNLYEFLELSHFRMRPGMYIGEKSITKLRGYISGYELCETINGIKSESTPPFWLFFHWIVKYYKHSGSYYNWDGIILQNCENDEAKALDKFFELFDIFRKITVSKILTAEITQHEISFFESHKPIRWKYIDSKEVRIGPAEKLYIIKYSGSFGCTIHHIKANKEIHSRFFTSLSEARKEVEREYGNKVKWKYIEENKVMDTYFSINRKDKA